MRRIYRMGILCVVFGLVCAASGRAEQPRRANGRPIPGTIKEVTDEGLVMETPKGVKTFPWRVLSAGTRYRHQPSFRANFDAIRKGLPRSARTNRVAEGQP